MFSWRCSRKYLCSLCISPNLPQVWSLRVLARVDFRSSSCWSCALIHVSTNVWRPNRSLYFYPYMNCWIKWSWVVGTLEKMSTCCRTICSSISQSSDHSKGQKVPHWQAHWSWFWEMAYKASQAWQNPEIQGASLAFPADTWIDPDFTAQNEIYDACIYIYNKIYYIL